jgi:hypothetical protein
MVADIWHGWNMLPWSIRYACWLLQLTLLSVQRKVGNSCRHRTQQLTVQAGDDNMCVQAHVSMVQVALHCKYQHRSLCFPPTGPRTAAHRCRLLAHAPRIRPYPLHQHNTICPSTVRALRFRTPGEQSGHCILSKATAG